MTTTNLAHSQARQQAQQYKGRLDSTSAANVERALELQTEAGNICAIEFMQARDIGADVILRVLTNPDQRRPRDGQAT